MTNIEQWKDIEGYEGKYQVSSLGRYRAVKSGKILKYNKHHKGYLKAQLFINGKTKGHFIHRLVAKAFIPNPDNKATVNHKNGDKSDNRVENLEWMTNQENMRHAYDNGIRDNSKTNEARKKPIAQYTKDGELVREYSSVVEALEHNPTFRQGGLSACALGRYHTSHGYVWRYI